MAIIQERKVQRIETYPNNGTPRLMVVYEYTFDDTEDDQLPVTTTKVVHLNKTTMDNTDPDNPVEVPTDVSGHDPLVQTIAAAVWAE
jgi:hypothetical protein